jgi:DNA-binding NtrC family response regulator
VLLTGESGTGKDLAALAVHHASRRAGRPFVVVNCAALPDTLIESELFGYEKGAFSGATQAKIGLFEAAAGGTLFLDEIGELSAVAQAKLLRVIEAKRVTRLGDTRERAVDFRVVSATNRDLEQAADRGTFRRDLYFRLGAARVALPPLRERPRELPVLARRFLDEMCERLELAPKRWSPAALRRLAGYAWPGNVRELKNVVEYLAAIAPGDEIKPDDLPPELDGRAAREFELEPTPPSAPASPPTSRSFRRLEDELAELERARMLEALEAASGVQKRAAELIGMPLRTFVWKWRRMQQPKGG